MSRRPRHGRRGEVSAEERELWTRAMRDVTPLKPLSQPELSPKAGQAPAASETPEPAQPPRPPAHEAPRRQRVPLASPPLTGLDRRTRQRLARGQAEFEARLDLHGMGAEAARMALARFLADAATHGRRLVLVITGKGQAPFARHTLHGFSHFDTPERHGLLRRKLPEWLAEPDLRVFVAGYQPAHPRHGGGGAFYVRLRRPERLGRWR